jgi:hypothetical protein
MLSLSPFLNSVFTVEYFKRIRKIPDIMDLLQLIFLLIIYYNLEPKSKCCN